MVARSGRDGSALRKRPRCRQQLRAQRMNRPLSPHELRRTGRLSNIADPLRVLDQVTPLIITHDEAHNIRRTLDKLVWARRIVVIDSGSTDDTLRLAQSYPQVEVVRHPF